MGSWLNRFWQWWRDLGTERLDTLMPSAWDGGNTGGYGSTRVGFDDGSGFGQSSLDDAHTRTPIEVTEINPATGLPMVGGIGGFDVAGNPYGIDLRDDGSVDFPSGTSLGPSIDDDHWRSASSMDDDWTSSNSSFGDDSWTSSSSSGSSWD